MLNNVDLEAVKSYNASLKQYKDKSAKLTVEIEYSEKELDTLCKQLTTELGVQVTPENIETIYNEQVEKINQALTTGRAILQKIEQEAINPVGTLPSMPGSPAPNPTVANAMPAPSLVGAPQPAPQLPPQPSPVFSGQAIGNGVNGTVDTLPPLNAGQPLFSI